MAWYFLQNEAGDYIGKKIAGRGRPPSGWVKSDEDLAPDLPEGSGVKVLEKPVKEKMFALQRDEDGKIIISSIKESSRSKVAVGWERISATELRSSLGSPSSTSSTKAPKITSSTKAPKITHIESIEAPSVANIEEEEEEDTGPQHFSSPQKMSYSDFISALHCTPHPDLTSDDIISFSACNVESRLDGMEEHFSLGQSYSRIDIIRSSGDIKLWTSDALAAHPDIVIEEALIDIED